MMATKWSRRVGSLACAMLLGFSLSLVATDADARAGRSGSFGSRGTRTWSAPPSTSVAPGVAAPITRSITPAPALTAPAAPGIATPGFGGLSRPGFGGGGFMSGLLGGFVGAGLVGMLFGSGFSGGMGGFGSGGGIGSILGLVLQLGLVFLLVRWGMKWFRNRSLQTAPRFDGGAYQPEQTTHEAQQTAYTPQRPLPMGRDMQVSPADFDVFEARLAEVQAAWSTADLNALRRLVTPEMLQYFGEQLATDSSRGVQNKIESVRLLKGDLAEAWEENGVAYASVAMEFQHVDYDVAMDDGAIVAGDQAALVVATEIWTFMRASGGQWMLSAIQQAA